MALQVLQYTTSLYFPSAVHVAGTSSSFTASPGVCPFALSVFFVLDISALQVLHLTTSSWLPSFVHVAGTIFSFTVSPSVCPIALSTLLVLDISLPHTEQYTTSSWLPSFVHVAGTTFSFTASPATCAEISTFVPHPHSFQWFVSSLDHAASVTSCGIIGVSFVVVDIFVLHTLQYITSL